jgi:hypothetical protein
MNANIKECAHDWRVNPFLIVPVLPTRVYLHCVKCDGTRTAPFHFQPKVSRRHDPTTWKKYTGELD